VPNVTGLGPGDAASQLRAAGLQAVERRRAVTDESQDGVVIDQRPPAGTEVDEGQSVVIILGVFEEPDTFDPGEEEPEGDGQ
jgi:beta-lactam-binding protein with PASTA domain